MVSCQIPGQCNLYAERRGAGGDEPTTNDVAVSPRKIAVIPAVHSIEHPVGGGGANSE